MKRKSRSKRFLRNDRGSALLVSLMVIVGLSLLGLGFVAISETETAIAKNQQAVLQTQAVAEAGAKLAVEWFQDPSWGETYGGLPKNNVATNPKITAIKVTRVSGGESGVYKPSGTTKLLDKPYRNAFQDRFWADENTGDIVINKDTDVDALNNINNILLGPNAEDRRTGELIDVRIFAPPMSSEPALVATGGSNPDGTPKKFWLMNGGQRYGVATIKATAAQFRDPNLPKEKKYESANILGVHAVRLVVGELPLPIPAGPIQGNANVSFGGNFQVHWGLETATGDLQTSGKWISLPWANAFERPHFEHGYEPGTALSQIQITAGGSGYATPPAVTISAAPAGGTTATAVAVVNGGAITKINLTNRGSGYSSQSPPTVAIAGGGGAGGSAIAVVASEMWAPTLGQFDSVDYFHELLGKEFQDPWYGARAVGDNDMDGATPNGTNPQCYPYTATQDEATTTDPSWAFQWQGVNKYPWQKKILFPVIKYDYWKKIAMQGRGYKGIYYFRYAGSGEFTKFGTGAANTMVYWANTLKPGAGMGPGVYFFDTVNGKNPQALTGAARTAELTPDEAWSSNDFGSDFLMEGFVYMNANSFGTKGQGKAPTKVAANYPGEPYRDVGYLEWDKAANAWTECPSGSGMPCRRGRGDAVHSCQDLNGNGRCDVVVMLAPSWTSNDPGAVAHASPFTLPSGGDTYIPKTWKSNAQATADYGAPCTIPAATYDGTNAANSDCSEPHEPFLNLIFPTEAMDANNKPNTLSIGWEKPSAQTYRAKYPGITCSKTSTVDECTSNGYDIDGGWVDLFVILYGVLYNEGFYNAEGNATYYGSVLIQDNIIKGNGTADVFFDEKLIKGSWSPANMPRVIVFNEQTDEEQQ
jgi:hypothetical protein